MWTITLTGNDQNKQKAYDIWGRHYFPRKFLYKSDVTKLWDLLNEKGIKAEYKKGKK